MQSGRVMLIGDHMYCADMCIQTCMLLFERAWVVNPEKQSDAGVVNFKS